MKNLLRLLLIVVVVLTMTRQSSAQTFGIKAGLNLSTLLAKDNDDTYTDNYKLRPGFHIGATAELPMNEIFSFETGLLLSTKGTNESETRYSNESSLTLYYFDIPLTAKAYYKVGSVRIYGVFGPSLGIGLSGKNKIKVSGSPDETQTIKWGTDSENDDLKRLDLGLTVGAGVEINAIQIGLAYNLGLANISAYTGDGYKIKNRVLGISVAYKFIRK